MVNYLSFSFKNLKHRGIRSWLTLLGIFIGITAVISLISLGNGLKAAVNAQFGVSSTKLISVQAKGVEGFGSPGQGAVKKLTKQDAEAIEKLSSVEIAIPRKLESIRIEYNDIVNFGYAGSLIKGKEEKMYELLDLEIDKGKLLKNGELKKVLLGYNFLDGDTNSYNKDILPGNKILIDGEKFEVSGILKKKGGLIFDNIVFMYDDDLNKLKNYGDKVDLIAVEVKNENLMDKAEQDIEKLLRKRRDVKKGEEDFSVSTPQATLKQVNKVLTGIQIFVIIIASISIIIGAIGIINTMTTSVLERKKEIGIMKAIGAKNSHIFNLFFVESGLLGLTGGSLGIIAGLFIGYLGTKALNNFLGVESGIQINIPLIVLSLIGSFLIGSIAGIFPAMNAAKQNPVDAIRGR